MSELILLMKNVEIVCFYQK